MDKQKSTEPVKIDPEFDELQNPQALITHIQQLQKEGETKNQTNGLFIVKTANEWLEIAKTSPIPDMLFGELWHKGELSILFSDSNLGKSILAVQIANSIAKGEQIRGFRLETEKQLVLYFDFELSHKQFEVRYSVKNEDKKICENHYSFGNNFKRIEIDPDDEIPTNITFEEYLHRSFENSIIDTGAKILIIDNLTYLNNETERAKIAAPLMKYLKALKNKYELSILALSHTPKRDLSRPINQNDLVGSKMLYNFADSSFAIGQSNLDRNLRYIKQIKARNTAMIYDAENVIVCQIDKPFNFLRFEFQDFGSEWEHLKQVTEKDREEAIEEAKELSQKGFSQREIAKEIGIAVGTVNKYLKL